MNKISIIILILLVKSTANVTKSEKNRAAQDRNIIIIPNNFIIKENT